MLSQAQVIENSQKWAAACDVQQRSMGRVAPGTGALDCSARCRQVHELGGDCFDSFPLAVGSLALAVGDASGKGLAAALMIANVLSSLRTAALFADDGATAVSAVNRQLSASSLAERYATLFYGVFDDRARTLRYVNAGHNPPLVLRQDGSITWLESGGAPLGMFPDWSYTEGTVQLAPGDVVVAYTDGVIEAADPLGEEWGVEGLQEVLAEAGARCADDIVEAVFTAMDGFSRGCQVDDVTVVALRVL